MVRRRSVASLARRCERSWSAYRQGSINSRNGAGLIWTRWLGRLGSHRSARPASRTARTHRSSRLRGPRDQAIGAGLLESRVNGDSSVERLGLRRREGGSVLEASGKPPFVGPNGSAASLGIACSPTGAELAGIPAGKRRPAKRCSSEMGTASWPHGRRWRRTAR
jgi:hypothetical protein